MSRQRWDSALDRIPENQELLICEIGVWTGTFSEQILINRPLVNLWQIDRWRAYTKEENIAEGNTRMSRYKQDRFDNARKINYKRMKKYWNKVNIFESDSTLAAMLIVEKTIDIVFHDANHYYEKVKADIEAWLPNVKSGGWMGGHDYQRIGVKKAVDEIFGEKVELDSGRTWWVRV